MLSVYKSILGTDPVTLIAGKSKINSPSTGSFTATCCLIVNTYSSDINVNLYLEIEDKVKDQAGDTLTSELDLHYFAYGLVIPANTSIDIFQYASQAFPDDRSLKFSLENSVHSADVSIKYERTGSAARGRTVNQY